MGGKELLNEIVSSLPEKAEIGEARFEGAGAVIFTRSPDFLFRAHEYLREVAKNFKLRVEARADRSLLLPVEEAQEKISKTIGDAEITSIFFDTHRSVVMIEVKKPSLVLGNGAEKLQELRRKIMWTPVIFRTPPLKSDVINHIRRIWTQNSKDRADFLNEVGMRIYSEGKDPKWVRVSFLGAAREVGRSSILLQTPESRLLMDCGVNVSSTENAFPVLDAPEFDISRLDAVAITHAHLDHSGFLPFLFKYGYRGPVYMTHPTLPLSVLLQLDYLEVAQREGNTVPYSGKEIEKMVLHTIPLPYEEVTNITPDLRLTFYNAGHILGSASIHIHVGEGFYNLVYTGDLKYGPSRLHEPAHNRFPRVEGVIMESTYGGRNDVQANRKESEDRLIELIKKTQEGGGKALVPVLGAGRAQEIMLIVHEAVRSGQMEELPIYVDGIVWDSTAIYTTYPEYLHKSIRKKVFSTEENPLLDPMFIRVGGQKDRSNIISRDESSLILATSGMLTGGPSVFYFMNLANDPRNSIVFVNYQAVGTLGRSVQRKPEEIVINERGERRVIKLNMQVHTVDGFSAHSDRKQLMAYIKNMEPRPGLVMPVHGEPSKCIELAGGIRSAFRMSTKVPNILDAFRLR